MRVACPECSAEYELPPALADRLTEGRGLRCARCGHTWVPAGTAVPPPPPPEPATVPEGPSGAAEETFAWPPRPGPGPDASLAEAPPPARGAALAWAASLLGLAAAAGAVWNWRVPLVEAWPPLARVFIALGLAG